MAFPTTAVLDDFNRTAETTLSQGGAWTSPLISGDHDLDTNGTQAYLVEASGFGDAYRTATCGPDCEVYFTVPTVGASAEALFIWLRIQNPGTAGQDDYTLLITKSAGTDTWEFYRGDDLDGTLLGSAINQEVSTGNQVGFEAIGSTLSAYINTGGGWSLVGSRVDATHGSAGNIGFGVENPTWRIDDFGGGTITTNPVISRTEYTQFPKFLLRAAA
jgi:hypothetical protein